ncbi:zinc knuckle CX2CX4HX4C containing protein [Tanacetum coccineum]
MEDSANITKALANDFNTFIATLNSDGMGDASVKAATSKPSNSFALVIQNQSAIKMVKIKELRNDEKVEGAAVAIPLSAVEEVSAHFSNTLYGYFIGKRLAFPLVENYVKNSWAKFGLKRVMLDEGFFLFQFETKEGMDKVMETGPWLIRLVH